MTLHEGQHPVALFVERDAFTVSPSRATLSMVFDVIHTGSSVPLQRRFLLTLSPLFVRTC
jgi:hypothetical protein